jgi:hypothetical protein
VRGNPLSRIDPRGLFDEVHHRKLTNQSVSQEGLGKLLGDTFGQEVADVDKWPGSQKADAEHSPWHNMCAPGQSADAVKIVVQRIVDDAIESCDRRKLTLAIHAVQDGSARGHKGCQTWDGHVSWDHLMGDLRPTKEEQSEAVENTRNLIRKFAEKCSCGNQ